MSLAGGDSDVAEVKSVVRVAFIGFTLVTPEPGLVRTSPAGNSKSHSFPEVLSESVNVLGAVTIQTDFSTILADGGGVRAELVIDFVEANLDMNFFQSVDHILLTGAECVIC